MYIFLITFLSLYGGMHFYAYIKLRNAFNLRFQLKCGLGLWMVLMTISPVIVRTAEHFWKEKTALLIAWPSFIWMGSIFIFASTLLFSDIISYSYRFMAKFVFKFSPKLLPSQIIIKVSLLITVFASTYAVYEASRIKYEHVVIHSPKLAASVAGIRIVQISDVHIGLLMREKRLMKIIEKINEAKPDIVVSTGDLLDGKLNRDDAISGLNPLATLLSTIQAPLGKYAAVGNHEIHAGLKQAVEFTEAAGFAMLQNQSIRLENDITITGINDLSIDHVTPETPQNEEDILKSVSSESYHIILKHRPDIAPENDGRFDLQLSGHIHDGQIFPFNLLVKLKHSIPCGTTTTQAGLRIHVSRGTGTWGPPMRLFAPPEVTIIDLKPFQKNNSK